MSKKIRTVFYAEEGAKSYIDGMLRHENFKSESDAISYLIALGMTAHTQRRINKALQAGDDHFPDLTKKVEGGSDAA